MAKIIRKELEQKLAALDGAEWDSMSESEGDEGSDGDELKPPPLPLRAQQKKSKRKGKDVASVVPVGPAGEPSGVVYIGHIPHGFYEEAMNGFFKQFGDVIRVRISRSKKSARCKVRSWVLGVRKSHSVFLRCSCLCETACMCVNMPFPARNVLCVPIWTLDFKVEMASAGSHWCLATALCCLRRTFMIIAVA